MSFRREGNPGLAAVSMLLFLLFYAFQAVSGEEGSHPGWQSHRNERVGYELSFPPSLDFKAYFEAGDLQERSSGRTLLRAELWPPDECMHAPGENLIVPMQTMALQRAKDVCQADGPNGSSYCSDPVTVKPFVSRNGARGVEMVLTRISEHCDTYEDDECVKPMVGRIEGSKGPVYAFDVSNERMTRILYLEPEVTDARVQEVLSSFKVFKVDPGPKPKCIQDL